MGVYDEEGFSYMSIVFTWQRGMNERCASRGPYTRDKAETPAQIQLHLCIENKIAVSRWFRGSGDYKWMRSVLCVIET